VAKQTLPTLESILGPNPRTVSLLINNFNGYWRVWVDTLCVKADNSPLRREIFRDRDRAKVTEFVAGIGWTELTGDLF
jgi:hypothetical protein